MRGMTSVRICWLVGLAVLLTTGCAAPETEEPVENFTVAEAPAGVQEKDGLRVTPLTDSPRFPGATLSIESLADRVASGQVAFDFRVDGYELGVQTANAGENGLANSGDGQHIHLILDNGPYSAHYSAQFEKEVGDGHHVMLAFLSRSYHESVKEPTAFVIRQFTVGDAEAEPVDLGGQHLFYSRPKGTYKGVDTERLMLDFFLVNTSISPDGNKVRAKINGSEFVFSEWVPYVIEGLPMGDVEISLELIDAAGEPVPGPFNSVTRTVQLVADEGAGT
jgi:hypothetical protein